MRTRVHSLGLGLLLALIGFASSASGLDLPHGTLTPGFGVKTVRGTFDHVVHYSPSPALPPGVLPQHFHSRGVFILDFNVAKGFVTAARIFKSTGNKLADDALVATLQQWRITPRTVYKLYVPVTVTAPGKFVFGTPP